MIIKEGKIVWSDVEVGVSQGDEHGVVDDVVVDTLENGSAGLLSLAHRVTSDLKRGVGDVQLRDPSDESRSSRLIGDASDV